MASAYGICYTQSGNTKKFERDQLGSIPMYVTAYTVEYPSTAYYPNAFNAMFTLRYSATHKSDSIYNMIYRLDAMEAYNKRLVKKIAVKGITESGSTATEGFVYLESINLSKADPTATIQFDFKGAKGLRKKTATVGIGYNLYDNSGNLDEYKVGFVVKSIDGRDNSVEFLNGIKIFAGDVIGKVSEDQLRRIQIRETILSHIERERQLFHKGTEDPLFFVLPDIASELSAVTNEPLSDEEKVAKRDQLLQNYSLKAERVHTVTQLLKAYTLFNRDDEYIVDEEGKVKIVDEQTGRIMEGRRYSDGLHQAIEAKEGVNVEAATQTFATITLQNYFRMYHKLAGMTGTAETEAGEFWEIYKLDVVTIPTNKPVLRNDMPDRVYKTQKEKFNAVIAEIEKMRNSGRPTLVGTTSVEISEMLSRMLRLRHIPHQVLNAKLHQQEADIVAQAGQSVDGKGVVTIATNMAGRGTDIKLSKEVKDAGGLAIIGTERHESRRVDRQLRGRAGRQGDPGSSVFFVSFEDKVMRLFASEKIVKLLDRLGLEDGEAIESPMVTKSIENAQKRVEENNFGIRKHTLEYDDVMNAQRKVIYTNRHHAVLGERIGLDIINTIYDTVEDAVGKFNDYEYEDFKMHVLTTFAIEPPFDEDEYRKLDKQDKIDRLYKVVNDAFNRKMERLREVATPVINQIAQQQLESGAPEVGGQIRVPIGDGKRMFGIVVNIKEAYETGCKNLVKAWQKAVLLLSIDENWKEHLRELDQLRQSVQNASYEQKDPLVIYKVESFKLFQTMLGVLNTKVVATLLRGQIPVEASDPDSVRREGERAPERTRPQQRLSENRGDDALAAAAKANAQAAQSASPQSRQPQAPLHVGPKVMPNDPCPCGSGKKYKKCHGRFA